ncbi:hypothetical protein CK203_062606 [Vitis vinifera]|uniref:Disease resistance R13L4/SHOC-2-like LRR domain-containing protein n=1 Tax=Vitis vinifera TaxID=29760 RepID=A0A438FZ32_VITVI|nr:hypothetical protein CK203_062606 [Vitis vinifera]
MRTQKEFHLQHLSEDEAWNLFKKTAVDSVEKPELHPIDYYSKIVAATFGALSEVQMMHAIYHFKFQEVNNPMLQTVCNSELKRRSCSHYKPVFLLLTIHEPCREKGAGNLKVEANFAALLGVCEISQTPFFSCKMVINFVDHFLNQGAPAEHKSAETPIGHESPIAVDVAKKCDGLPVAIVTIANALRGESVHVWENALEELRRSAPTNIRGVSKDVYSCLELSYNHLESDEVKSLFLLCGVLGLGDIYMDFLLLYAMDIFFQDTKELTVLDLSGVSLKPSPSSLGFLLNLRTLCLNRCVLEDIAVIGHLERLQVLCLACFHIYQLPKEMMELSDLRVLDLRYCFSLKVIPQNLIFSLSRLEYLSMKGSVNIEWEAEGFNSGERINACLSELKHLSGLRTLELEVSNPSLLPEDDVILGGHTMRRNP